MHADKTRNNQADTLGLPPKDFVLLGVYPPFSAVNKSLKTVEPPSDADARR